MRVPTRSAGTRSGVNWTRPNVPPTTWASVLTVSVLARPGTPSSRTWPPASRQTSTRSSIASWPTITRLTSWRASSSAARGSGLGCSALSDIGFLSGKAAEPPQGHGAGGEQHQQPRSGEPRGHLLLLGDVAELRAEPLVDGVELRRVGDLVGLPAGRPGHRLERRRVGRDVLGAAVGLDRAARGAERHGVDRDLRV